MPHKRRPAQLPALIWQSIADSWLIRISLAVTLVLLAALAWIKLINLFASQGFGPHGECLLWLPGLITLFVSSDMSIGLSYVCISIALIYFVHRTHRIMPFKWVFVAFGIFIIACGSTHFIDVLTLWIPVYWLEGTVKLITALASITTAIAYPLSMPKMLAFVQHASVSAQRQEEIEQAYSILQAEAEKEGECLVSLARNVVHANHMQRNFVTVASHEVRTALTGICGFSGLMSEEILDPAEVKEYAADILSEANRLTRMITDMLDLERMKSGQMTLTLEHIDLNALIHKVLDQFRLTSEHTFRLQLDDTLPACTGDADKLIQVMTNLLSNAIKYAPGGGDILVGSRTESGTVLVWVEDYGVGIPSEFLEEVFVPYSRIDAGTTRYIKGTGLGLSISRQIIQMHGGHIWVESTPGQGSRFSFTLPFSSLSV